MCLHSQQSAQSFVVVSAGSLDFNSFSKELQSWLLASADVRIVSLPKQLIDSLVVLLVLIDQFRSKKSIVMHRRHLRLVNRTVQFQFQFAHLSVAKVDLLFQFASQSHLLLQTLH